MSELVKNGRWAVREGLFASRIIIPDVKGFFLNLPLLGETSLGRQLIIEPGTKAVMIDDGVVLGEAHAGSFTLQSFTECLQFWKGKQCTAVISRAEDIVIAADVPQAFSLEGVSLNLHLELQFSMKNILSFLTHLMGARSEITIDDLHASLAPTISQAAREVLAATPIENITHPNFASTIGDGIRSRIDVKLQRYGLSFIDVQTVSHDCQADKLKAKQGETFLRSRETDVQIAAAEVSNDRVKKKLEIYQQRIPMRAAVREVFNDDKLNGMQSGEDLKKAILEIDKQRLLRKEEQAELVEAFNERKEDRAGMRDHLVATIDLQREKELDDLRSEIEHAARMKSLEQEIEYSNLSDSHDKDQWRAELEKDKEEAEHRFSQRQASADAKWAQIRSLRENKREETWDSILHEQKMEEIKADLEVSRDERRRKLAVLEAELQTRLATEKLTVEKQQKEWELELKQQKSANQIERLQKVQEMNARFAEQQQRMQLELETLKEDSAHKREIERMQAMGSLSTEAMIATAGSDNAALLADLKKHEASQETAKVQATHSTDAALNEERLRMYEKMNDSEKAKADAIAQAYKDAMQAQQANVSQMIGGLAQANTPQAPAAPGYPPAQPAAAPPPMPAAEVWHISINGSQSPPMNLQQVQQSIQTGQVVAETMVWKTGMASWQAANTVPELAAMFGPPSVPQGGMPPGPPPS